MSLFSSRFHAIFIDGRAGREPFSREKQAKKDNFIEKRLILRHEGLLPLIATRKITPSMILALSVLSENFFVSIK
jgi:hypothetical protein